MEKINRWIPEKFVSDLVSVIIPTFNRVVFLREAIESVISQTYRPVECIVVDDGSTEDVKALVDDCRSTVNDIEIKYISQVNSGAQVARNTGTKMSKGEYVQYLDSDDLLYPQKLYEQVEYLKTNREVDAVFGDWETGDKEHPELIEVYATEDLVEQFLTDKCIANFSMLMKRDFVNEIGPWDETLKRYQEIDYHLRGVVLGSQFIYQKTITGLFRTHSESRITTTEGAAEVLRFYQKWETILTSLNRFTKEIKVKFATLYLWFFYTDVRYGPTQISLLKAIYRIHPKNSVFHSKKFLLMKKMLGLDVALRFFLAWMLYNIEKQNKKK